MKHSKSGLFLMEIMFSILFFSIASAVCLQLFARAHTLSHDASVLDAAVTACQSAASVLEAEGADLLSERYAGGKWADGSFTAPLDDCTLCISPEGDAYEIRALSGDGTEIYSLRLLKRAA